MHNLFKRLLIQWFTNFGSNQFPMKLNLNLFWSRVSCILTLSIKALQSIYHKLTFSGIFKNFEIFILDTYHHGYASVMKTFIKKLRHWSYYLNTIIISNILWITALKSFWMNYLSNKTLITWLLKGDLHLFYHI